MADRTFKISITGDASGLTASTKEGGEALDSLSPKTQKYIQALKEEEAWANKAGLSHRELTRGLQMVSPALAHLGHAAFLAEAGPLGALLLTVGALTKGFEAVVEHHRKMKEALEGGIDIEPLKRAAETLGNEGFAKAVDEAGVAIDAFWGKLARAAGAQDTLREKTDDAIEAIKRQAEATKHELGEEEKREIARIDALEKTGQLTKAQADEQKNTVRERAQKMSDLAASNAERAAIDARKKEQGEAGGKLGAAKDEVTGKELAAAHAEQEVKNLQAELAKAHDATEKQQAWIKDHLGDLVQSGGLDAANRKLKFLERGEDDTADKLPGAQKRAAEAKASATEVETTIEHLQKRLQELAREIPKLETEHREGEQRRGSEAETRRQTHGYEEAGARGESAGGKMTQMAEQAEMAHEAGQQGTAKQEAAFAAFHKAFGAAADATLRGLVAAHNIADEHTRRINDIVKRLEALSAQQKGGHTP